MIRTRTGYFGTNERRTYEAGKSYQMPKKVAEMFLRRGWGEEDKAMDEAPEVKGEPSGEDLSQKTVEELRDLAKERGIHGYWEMKKSELIEALG